MVTPITPFLLVSTANESILQRADQKLKFLRIQKMTLSRPTTLRNYVQQIRNYQAYTHMVIDISAVEERDEDFIEALEAIRMFRDDMRLIIYAVDLKNNEDFFDALVNHGFTNIVAVLDEKLEESAKWEQIQNDILECFSEKGLSERRWRTYQKVDLAAMYEAERQARAAEELKRKIPDFSKLRMKICIFGTDSRVGATTVVLVTASYFSAGNANVKVVLRSQEQLSALKRYLNINDGSYDKPLVYGENIVFTSSGEQNESFNIVIEDMGKYSSVPLQA
ncbi:MAG: hypothetical protein NC452_20125, partial [Eubacterium sp.]|nr:hypothetical protein [Eubacterium sp.]